MEAAPISLVRRVAHAFQRFAPVSLAASWDNVGILVEPSVSFERAILTHDSTPPKVPRRVMLTIDLTSAVLQEAITREIDVIVAYHPPIFHPMKSLVSTRSAKQDVLLQAIERRMGIYSPHTALDSVCGGINDWLCDALGGADAPRTALTPCSVESWSQLSLSAKYGLTPSNTSHTGAANERDEAALRRCCGSGRLVTLPHRTPFKDLLTRLRQATGIGAFRVATPFCWHKVPPLEPGDTDGDHAVQTIALCAGSGASVLLPTLGSTYSPPTSPRQKVGGHKRRPDVLLSGEMGHDEVLQAIEAGCGVIYGTLQQ